jgi:hypothetical protein
METALTPPQTCGAQTYSYTTHKSTWCHKIATRLTRAMDGSTNPACAEHAAIMLAAGARDETPVVADDNPHLIHAHAWNIAKEELAGEGWNHEKSRDNAAYRKLLLARATAADKQVRSTQSAHHSHADS